MLTTKFLLYQSFTKIKTLFILRRLLIKIQCFIKGISQNRSLQHKKRLFTITVLKIYAL